MQMGMPVKVSMAVMLVLMSLTLMVANLRLFFLRLTPLQPVLRHTPSCSI